MEFSSYLFASILIVIGVFLVLRLREELRGGPRAEAPPRVRQWSAYEERRMRVQRDRVWWKVESLHSEFNEREAGGGRPAARVPAPRRPGRGGGDPRAVTSGDVRAAYDQFAAAHDGPQERRDETPAPHRNRKTNESAGRES